MVASRVVAAATSVIGIPIALNYLGPTRFGIWAVIASTAAFLALADFGLGPALVNPLTEHLASDDHESTANLAFTAFVAMALLGAMAFATLTTAAVLLPWTAWLDVPDDALRRESVLAAIAVGAVISVSLPLSVAGHVRVAQQESHITALHFGIGAVLSLLFTIIAAQAEAPLALAVIAMSAGSALGGATNTAHLVLRQPWLLSSRQLRLDRISSLWSTGRLFLGLNLASFAAYSADTLLAGVLFGAPEAATYAVPFRAYSALSSLLWAATRVLWPAFADAHHRGEAAWVRRVLLSSILLALGVTSLIGGILTFAAPGLIGAWTGQQVRPSLSLSAGLSVWLTIGTAGNVVAMFLTATNDLSLQLRLASLNAVVNVAVSILLSRAIGVPGLIWGTVVAYVSCVLVPYSFAVRDRLRRAAS